MYRDALSRARNGVFRRGPDPTYADGDDAHWMSVEWPSLSRSVEIDGRRVGVVDSGGDGPPLLFLHGLGGLWQNWLLTMPAFMGTHRCVALDLPGFGMSELPAGEISIPGFARTVDAVCAKLGIEEPVVVGNSMGGFVGAELAVSFPTRVSKLVLVAAAGLSTEYLVRQPLLAAARMWAVMTARTGVRAEVAVTRPRTRRATLQVVVRYPERLSVPLSMELVRGADAPGFIPAFDALMRHSHRQSLERIEIPVLIVWGRNDILVPVDDAEMYEHLIGENAHSVIFEDTGHLPMVERPSRFNSLLAGFIAGERAPERGVEGVSA
ncbi:MAG TPA: alpha/beta hydrolase [Solirubrobacteraceae bacterium]|jgi:pimeloyl-ACP methyl ester carboxylesterase|nr:alpha/beta hydrolase [Solirubrobacteraceae bacterium]